MAGWLNTNTLAGLMMGAGMGLTMGLLLGWAAGIPIGLGVGLVWAVVFNSSRTATGGDMTDKDAD
ncbi:MAG: hypothetical protein ACFE0P_16020 [Oceanicaulis sp.]